MSNSRGAWIIVSIIRRRAWLGRFAVQQQKTLCRILTHSLQLSLSSGRNGQEL
jgi:hypothetical protein